MAIEIAGNKWDLYVGAADGTGFERVVGVQSVESDISDDTVERDFIDGSRIEIQGAHSTAFEFVLTDVGQENLEKIIPGYQYANSDAIDGVDGVTVGSGGATSLNLARGSYVEVPGVVKLVPKLAAQADKTVYIFDAVSRLTDFSFDDGLLELTIRISSRSSGEQVVMGDLVFDGAS